MPQLLFKNFELLEPSFGELHGGYQLLVEGETIRELSDKPIKAAEAEIVDCGGRSIGRRAVRRSRRLAATRAVTLVAVGNAGTSSRASGAAAR